jgi:hypothetical protein
MAGAAPLLLQRLRLQEEAEWGASLAAAQLAELSLPFYSKNGELIEHEKGKGEHAAGRCW